MRSPSRQRRRSGLHTDRRSHRSTKRCSNACGPRRGWRRRRAESSRSRIPRQHGKRLTTGGAPAFVASEMPARFESFKPVKGTFPTTAQQVAIDEATAERASLKVGERMIVAGSAPARTYTIVGITRFGGGASFGGAGAAILTPAEAQRVVAQPGRYDEIDVAANPGVTNAQLRDRLRAVLPASVDVRPAPSRRRRTRRTSKETFRSSAHSCSYSPTCRCSWARSSSSTRSRSPLRSEHASSAFCARSARPRTGHALGDRGKPAPRDRGCPARAARRPPARSGPRPALQGLRADLPDSGTVLKTRTIVVSLAVGVSVTVLAGLDPRSGRDARAAARGHARGHRAARGRLQRQSPPSDARACSSWPWCC